MSKLTEIDYSYLEERALVLGDHEAPAVTHAIIRTSPKGKMFLGTCTLCGTPSLTMRAAWEPCPNQRGLSNVEALLDIVVAPRRLEKGAK